jgi:hypothetical protein
MSNAADLPPHGAALRPAVTDWLYHRLTIEGLAADVTVVATAAQGAGVIPWSLDLAVMEEDLFHRLIAPPPPQVRSLSLDGARALARQLCEASAARHAAALARVGISRACPFDLHALLPVPSEILVLGPDDPAAELWLWTHWGTTQALRHVELAASPRRRTAVAAGRTTLGIRFWSADWTPWRAVQGLAKRWPAVRFTVQPVYDLG